MRILTLDQSFQAKKINLKDYINFKYYKSFKIILVIANAHKVLEKRDIQLSDLRAYKERLKEIVKTA